MVKLINDSESQKTLFNYTSDMSMNSNEFCCFNKLVDWYYNIEIKTFLIKTIVLVNEMKCESCHL